LVFKILQVAEPVFSVTDELVLQNFRSVLRKGLDDNALLSILPLFSNARNVGDSAANIWNGSEPVVRDAGCVIRVNIERSQQVAEPVFSVTDELVLQNFRSVLRKGLDDVAALSGELILWRIELRASFWYSRYFLLVILSVVLLSCSHFRLRPRKV
jgi:hypothetical protein